MKIVPDPCPAVKLRLKLNEKLAREANELHVSSILVYVHVTSRDSSR